MDKLMAGSDCWQTQTNIHTCIHTRLGLGQATTVTVTMTRLRPWDWD